MSSENAVMSADPGGESWAEGILKRIKEIEGISRDTDLLLVLKIPKSTLYDWRSRGVNLTKISEYARERQISLEYLVNARGPVQIKDMVSEPGAIYRVETDQDAVYDLAADAYRAILESDARPAPEKFAQLLKVLHRENIDLGTTPTYERIRELVKLME